MRTARDGSTLAKRIAKRFDPRGKGNGMLSRRRFLYYNAVVLGVRCSPSARRIGAAAAANPVMAALPANIPDVPRIARCHGGSGR